MDDRTLLECIRATAAEANRLRTQLGAGHDASPEAVARLRELDGTQSEMWAMLRAARLEAAEGERTDASPTVPARAAV